MSILSKFIALGSYMCPVCGRNIDTSSKKTIWRCSGCGKRIVIEDGEVKGWRP